MPEVLIRIPPEITGCDGCSLSSFLPLGRRRIVIPFVRLRRRLTHSFGYYTNMVQQIEFIIHTNFQPLRALFLPKVKDLKKILLTR